MNFTYSVFGLLLHSNLPLSGILPVDSPASPPDVELRLGISAYADGEVSPDDKELTYVSPYSTETGEPALHVWLVAKGAFLHIVYSDGTQFWLDQKRETLWAVWADTSSLENTVSYLFGPVLGLLLRLRDVTCLHASAVAFEDRSVAFVGAAGAGKSTTAAAFAQQGYGVLSDDITALMERGGTFHIMPAYPHLGLWPDSVEMLYGSAEALPRFMPEWDKRRLDLGERGTRFESRPLPLRAVYIFGERGPDPAPSVEFVRQQDALLSLVAGTYANAILGPELRAREFAVLSRLVETVPIRRVRPHHDPSRLGKLCTVIREDIESLDL